MSDQTIKSVRRLFEVLALFNQEQRPLAAREIGKALGYPLTSAHALLKSMHELGYANFYPENLSYTPSSRLLELLTWTEDAFHPDPALIAFLNALSTRTKETINISRQADAQIKIVYGLETLHTVGISVKVGTLMPISASLTGLTLLASYNSSNRRALLNQVEQREPEQFKAMDTALFQRVQRKLKRSGSVMECDVFVQGVGAICMPIETADHSRLVLGIVGPSERIESNTKTLQGELMALCNTYAIQSTVDS